MKFYNREKEIELLNEIQKKSLKNAQFTLVTGRRRIGKTQLILKVNDENPILYFFVAKKAENYLCADFQQEVSLKLNVPILGEINKFAKLFEYLMLLSKERPFTLIIDEFQEFYKVEPSIYSDIQHYWDIHHNSSKMNLIVCGSVYSLMHKIFENQKEPLFGRASAKLHVKPFELSVLKEILYDHNPNYSNEDLLALYSFTGGVAKYVQLLMNANATTYNDMLHYIIKEDSVFINEGKNMLIDEFGTEYAIYFTILSAIARGENTRGKIEAIVKKEIGGYLTKLEHDYSLISKILPLLSKVENKNVRFVINDNLLIFWFRFIYKFSYLVEIENFEELKSIIDRDYKTFSGKMLEKYFFNKIIQTQNVSRIGGFWDKKGENEIDLVVIKEMKKEVQFIEIKRNPTNINIEKLKLKADYFVEINKEVTDFERSYLGFSMTDM